ncbi:hypothetical protein ACFOD9_11940 [Novosphingobium bradum]|uniref:DUF1214 domain-containing protein n=1 Tax=Novosphingobium bradum TaxID=1737444 RepID=A0ABV7IQL7_9SPHN
MTAAPIVDLFEQLQLEREALRVLAAPAMQAAMAAAAARMRESWQAQTPDGAARLDDAVRGYALAAIENTILDDPARPRIMWIITQPHQWHGQAWPGSMWGGHNPDNFSRDIMIDDVSTYEISGRRTGPGPAQATFLVYDSFIGTTAQSTEGANIIASLLGADLMIDGDGDFRITVGPGAGAPGTNHLQTRPGAKVLKIRNSLEDWAVELPDQLRVRRLAGPPAGEPRSADVVAERAAALLATQIAYWLTFLTHRAAGTVNETRPPQARAGGWGYLAGGRFALGPDEALVVTIDTLRADYIGFQVSDDWMTPPDYIHHTAGLNRSQARPDADGAYTFVIAARDPGVWNWIDTVGLGEGGYSIRWQGGGDPAPPIGQAVRQTRLARIAELKDLLPAGTVWTDAAMRQAQIAHRVETFWKRVGT